MFQRERPKASLLRNGCSRISVRFQNQMFIMVYFILIILPAFSPTLRVSLSLRWWHCCTICGTQYSFLCKILECGVLNLTPGFFSSNIRHAFCQAKDYCDK